MKILFWSVFYFIINLKLINNKHISHQEHIMSYRKHLLITRNLILCFVLIIFFSGCATMKKDECLTADWYNIGFEDGARGHKVSRIANHRKACSKYEIAPDLDLYLRGRDQGLIEYCTAYNGYNLGLKGRAYNDACQGNLKNSFLEAYNIGKDIYLFERDVKAEQRELGNLNNEMADLDKLIKDKELELSGGCSDVKICKEILDDIRFLDNEKNRVEYEIKSKQNLINGMKNTLVDMKNKHRFY